MVPAGNNGAARWHGADQLAKGGLHRGKILIDIGMVELHRCNNQRLGVVVKKLGSFIEEGGVVLVPLHHEVGPRAFPERTLEIPSNPPNEKGGLATRRMKQICAETRRGRLSMGARDRHAMLGRDGKFVERIGKGSIGQP